MRGLATRRARWNPRLPLTVGVVVVLGAALPAALAVGGATMLDDGVRAAVTAAGPGDRGVQVSARLDPSAPAVQDRAARAVLARTFEGVPTGTWPGLRSGNLPVNGLPASPAGELRLVAEVLPDVAGHARLVAGRWPSAPSAPAAPAAPIAAALHEGAARELGVAVGDRLSLGAPGTPTARTVDVVGLWRAGDSGDPYWFGDPLELTGVERDTVLGPLVVAAGPDGAPPDVGDQWTARWRTVVDPAGLGAGDAERLARRLVRLEAELEEIPTAGGNVARTAGGLAATLAYPRLAVPLARSATVAVLVLVVGLVVVVASQAAALLAADRARESGVIRARGGTGLQQLRLTGAELLAVAALATVPAALLAAATLGPLLGAVARPLPVGLAAAAGCLGVAVVVSVAVHVLLARRRRAGGHEPRATLDVALAAALGVALWQLWTVPRDRDGAATAPGGQLVDPVLAVAPVVALGAAAVLVVRALRPLGRVLGRLARRDGVLPALVGWHAARRATRPAAPLVAVVVVAAAAVVTLSARAGVEHVTRDRTAAEGGGDVVVEGVAASPPLRSGDVATPVVRLPGTLGQEDVEVLALDAARVPAVTADAGRWQVPAADARRLVPPPAERRGTELAAGPELSLRLRMTVEIALPSDFLPLPPGATAPAYGPRIVTALLAAPDGTQRQLRMPDLTPDGEPHTLTAPFPPGLAGTAGVRLVGLQVDFPQSGDVFIGSIVEVLEITSGGRPAAGSGTRWDLLAVMPGPVGTGEFGPLVDTGTPGVVVRFAYTPAWANGLVTMRVLPERAPPGTALPCLVTEALARRMGLAPGATLDGNLEGRALRLQVAGILPGLPGGRPADVPDDGVVPAPPAPDVLVDLATLGEVTRSLPVQAVPDPREWWVGTAGGDAAATAAGIRAAAPKAQVRVLDEVAERRLADPFADGLRRIFLLAALAALAVALGALLLGDVVTAAARRGELVVLRALGMAGGQVRRLLVVERALVGGASLVAGLALGLAVTPVVVPALLGVPAAAGAGVAVAWLPVAGVALFLALAVAAGAVAAGRRAGRLEPAVVLREDPG